MGSFERGPAKTWRGGTWAAWQHRAGREAGVARPSHWFCSGGECRSPCERSEDQPLAKQIAHAPLRSVRELVSGV